jgi:hypothetical protein
MSPFATLVLDSLAVRTKNWRISSTAIKQPHHRAMPLIEATRECPGVSHMHVNIAQMIRAGDPPTELCRFISSSRLVAYSGIERFRLVQQLHKNPTSQESMETEMEFRNETVLRAAIKPSGTPSGAHAQHDIYLTQRAVLRDAERRWILKIISESTTTKLSIF